LSATRSKHGGANVRFPPPLVFAAAIATGFLIQRAGYVVQVPVGRTPRLIVAGTLGLLALALILPSQLLFRRSGQHPAPWKPSPSLIVQGPYRFSRNPMYASMLLLQMALGVGLDNPWIVLLSAPALMAVHYIAVLPEERYLGEKFGEDYRLYASRVRRYL
jgi:protein-S-isoprenylcysteine O-methyltransferase Ste14